MCIDTVRLRWVSAKTVGLFCCNTSSAVLRALRLLWVHSSLPLFRKDGAFPLKLLVNMIKCILELTSILKVCKFFGHNCAVYDLLILLWLDGCTGKTS